MVFWPQAREEMDRLQGQRRSEVVTRMRDTGTTSEEAARSFERRLSRPGSAASRAVQVCRGSLQRHKGTLLDPLPGMMRP